MSDNRTTNLQRAIDHIGATRLGSGKYAYFAHETGRYYIISLSDLGSLCDYLDNTDPAIARDAYSHWCAGTVAEEMLEGWEP